MKTVQTRKYIYVGLSIHVFVQLISIVVAILNDISMGKIILFVVSTFFISIFLPVFIYAQVKFSRRIYQPGWLKYQLFVFWVMIYIGVCLGLGYLFINLSQFTVGSSIAIAALTLPVVAQWEYKMNEAHIHNQYVKNHDPTTDEYEDRLYGK